VEVIGSTFVDVSTFSLTATEWLERKTPRRYQHLRVFNVTPALERESTRRSGELSAKSL
jgi:hypothetical protein